MRSAANRAVSASGISEIKRPVKISAALKIYLHVSVMRVLSAAESHTLRLFLVFKTCAKALHASTPRVFPPR